MAATAPLLPSSISAGPRPVVLSSLPTVFGTARGDLIAAGVLSGVAGYVDAAGFLGLFGLFTAQITGDLVTTGTTFAHGVHQGLGLRLAALLAFMVSVAISAVVARALRRRGGRPLTALFALMTLALAVFCATGVILHSRQRGPDDWSVVVTGAIGVFGMGIQNTLMRDILSGLGPTTLMTGNLTQLTMDLVEIALAGDEKVPPSERARHLAARGRLLKSSTSVLGFLLGTVAGGAAMAMWGFWSVSFPTAVVAALTVSTWLRSRTREGRPLRALRRPFEPPRAIFAHATPVRAMSCRLGRAAARDELSISPGPSCRYGRAVTRTELIPAGSGRLENVEPPSVQP